MHHRQPETTTAMRTDSMHACTARHAGPTTKAMRARQHALTKHTSSAYNACWCSKQACAVTKQTRASAKPPSADTSAAAGVTRAPASTTHACVHSPCTAAPAATCPSRTQLNRRAALSCAHICTRANSTVHTQKMAEPNIRHSTTSQTPGTPVALQANANNS